MNAVFRKIAMTVFAVGLCSIAEARQVLDIVVREAPRGRRGDQVIDLQREIQLAYRGLDTSRLQLLALKADGGSRRRQRGIVELDVDGQIVDRNTLGVNNDDRRFPELYRSLGTVLVNNSNNNWGNSWNSRWLLWARGDAAIRRVSILVEDDWRGGGNNGHCDPRRERYCDDYDWDDDHDRWDDEDGRWGDGRRGDVIDIAEIKADRVIGEIQRYHINQRCVLAVVVQSVKGYAEVRGVQIDDGRNVQQLPELVGAYSSGRDLRRANLGCQRVNDLVIDAVSPQIIGSAGKLRLAIIVR